MANETRVRKNFLKGSVENAPLLIAGTTLTSADLATMSVVDASNHIAIVLDPKMVAGAPEIVWVTAHVASATTATILRGQEGTTAREHAATTVWQHGPTAQDFVAPAVSGTRISNRTNLR